jgi:hypothetical protein
MLLLPLLLLLFVILVLLLPAVACSSKLKDTPTKKQLAIAFAMVA